MAHGEMRIYMAGAEVLASRPGFEQELRHRRVLVTFFNLQATRKFLDRIYQQSGWDVVIDSGAFSAYQKGERISLGDYCAFLRDYGPGATWYASLDVIGSGEDSLRNYLRMLDLGFRPVPAWHYGEPLAILDRYLDTAELVAYGGFAAFPKRRREVVRGFARAWLHRPGQRVHLFGATSSDVLTLAPWESADSIVWLKGVRWGLVPVVDGLSIRFVATRQKDLRTVGFYCRRGKEYWHRAVVRGSEAVAELERRITALWEERLKRGGQGQAACGAQKRNVAC